MIDKFEESLSFYYQTLEEERKRFSLYKGLIKQISGVRINVLIGTVDIAEAAFRAYRNKNYEFGAKLSARAMILHIHEVIDSSAEFEFRLHRLSEVLGFDSIAYLLKIQEFSKVYRNDGLKTIRGLNKVRDIYGHSDPDWVKVIGIVDEIDLRKTNQLTALALNYREILVRWTSELKNYWAAKFYEAAKTIENHNSGVKIVSDEDVEKFRIVSSSLNNEVAFTPKDRKAYFARMREDAER